MELSSHSGLWVLLGLFVGWLLRDTIKSAFEGMTGLFNNPIYQAPDIHWK